MKREIAMMAGSIAALAFAASRYADVTVDDDYQERTPKAKPRGHAPIVETRQKPKEKSDSLRRMLKSKGRR